MEKTTYLMTPGQREKLLAELREESFEYESNSYSWERVSQRPRFHNSGIPVELFESFGMR